MARITTGATFGITRREALICRDMFEGKSIEDICKLYFNVRDANGNVDKSKVTAARRKIGAMTRKKAFQECYKGLIREVTFERIGDLVNKLYKQTDDANPWVANKAINDYLTRFQSAVTGEDSNEVVVRVEGMPNIGTPDDANPVIAAPDDIIDTDDDDVDDGGE